MVSASQHEVRIGRMNLPGEWLPPRRGGIVVFAHGSGSGRSSPRNRLVARSLQARGLGTLLFDLLTEDEAADRRNVFDITLLGRRVVEAVQWLDGDAARRTERIGLFGASTGAAAALAAAAALPQRVAAVVSRGGRPDLAGAALAQVRAPTLLIVGGRDTEVLDLNRQAQAQMTCACRLAVVPGATHLFEEPGTLEQVAALAGNWFGQHLAATQGDRP
jgi:pimeloyl-ACP methyl ester carboxylesterase